MQPVMTILLSPAAIIALLRRTTSEKLFGERLPLVKHPGSSSTWVNPTSRMLTSMLKFNTGLTTALVVSRTFNGGVSHTPQQELTTTRVHTPFLTNTTFSIRRPASATRLMTEV